MLDKPFCIKTSGDIKHNFPISKKMPKTQNSPKNETINIKGLIFYVTIQNFRPNGLHSISKKNFFSKFTKNPCQRAQGHF